MLPTTENTRLEGFSAFELYGSVECIREVNTMVEEGLMVNE